MFRLSVVTAVVCAMAASHASAQVLPPTGIGGCIFLGISREMRLAVMGAYGASGGGALLRTPGLRAAVSGPARRCSGGRDIGSDDALLVAFTSTVMRSVEALELSNEGAAQARLDAAWTGASDTQRAPFLAGAQAYFDAARPPDIPAAAIDALVSRLELQGPVSATTRQRIVRYYRALALNALAEANLSHEPADRLTRPPSPSPWRPGRS